MNPFTKVAGRQTKRSKFDLSHEKKLSTDIGVLTPILCQEIVPGDKFRVNSELMLRFAPLVAPVMHRMDVYVHYFFVPNRLIWNDWETFITGGRQGIQEPAPPTIAISEATKSIFSKGRLPDYLGIPPIATGTTVTQDLSISALPFRAYQEIWQEYYRDPNLTEKVDVDLMDTYNVTNMRKRAWEKDYFTSALPWAQRGADVILPMDNQVTYLDHGKIIDGGGVESNGDASAPLNAVGSNPNFQVSGVNGPINIKNIQDIESQLTINDLRKSVRLQEWLERTARGGYRYIEQIMSHFGVRSSDARLQRPEYLGGGKQAVVISEVLNTTGTNEAPQGDMAGHGIAVGTQNRFQRSFEEHGFVMGIMSVLPKTAYQQGINRMFLRDSKFDYYWPEFAQLGEQEVKLKELFYDPTGVDADKTFGYQSRFAEYKYQPSEVSGDFRDDLKHWHLSRIFSTKPNLNETFIECSFVPYNDRIFAVADGNHLWCQVYNRVDAIRPMPYFNNPTL